MKTSTAIIFALVIAWTVYEVVQWRKCYDRGGVFVQYQCLNVKVLE